MDKGILEVKVVKCCAVGLSFVSGISSRYDSVYPQELDGYILEDEFIRVMDRLNDKIAEFWPCNTCYIFGYACAPFTLGTSLFCPNYCISEAENSANRYLEDVSLSPKYFDRNIRWSIRKTCFKSWVEISFPIQPSQPVKNNTIVESKLHEFTNI